MNRYYTLPKIYPHNPCTDDMCKDWFVWFRIYDPSTDKWIQKSFKKGINNYKKFRDRLAYFATNKDVYALMRQLRHKELSTTMIYLKNLGLIQKINSEMR